MNMNKKLTLITLIFSIFLLTKNINVSAQSYTRSCYDINSTLLEDFREKANLDYEYEDVSILIIQAEIIDYEQRSGKKIEEMSVKELCNVVNNGGCSWDEEDNLCIRVNSPSGVTCSELDNSKDCVNNYCTWTGATCINSEVAKYPCSEADIQKALKILGWMLLIAKLLVPLLIIGYGTIDLFKAVIDKDEKSFSKEMKQLGVRIIVGIIVFYTPTIINAFFGITDALNIIETDQYKECANCLLEPSRCGSNLADENGNCPDGRVKGIDGICYKIGDCGSYTIANTCPRDKCTWSARNGCNKK